MSRYEHSRFSSLSIRSFAPVMLLAGMLLLQACSFGMSGAYEDQKVAENSCRTDNECRSASSRCDVENKVCVSQDDGAKNLLVEVIPSSPSGALADPSQYFVYEGETNVRLEDPFELRDTIHIKGVVKWGEPDGSAYLDLPNCSLEYQDLDGQCIVSAKLELIPEGDFPESLRQTTTVTTSQTTVRDGEGAGDFEITLVPGIYTLRVVPEAPFDAYLPPMIVFEKQLVEASQNLIVRYDSLESVSTYGKIDSVAWLANEQALTNISVWAVDPATGRRVSSIATVDSAYNADPDGTWTPPEPPDDPSVTPITRLYLFPQDLQDGQFTIYISSNEEVPTIPNIKFGPFDFYTLDTMNDADADDYINMEEIAGAGLREYSITLPAVGTTIKYQASVEGVNPDGSVEPIDGVRVKFQTEDIGGDSIQGSYEMFATTQDGGLIFGPDERDPSVPLLAGDYTVTLFPPLDGDFEAARVTGITITDPGGGVPISGQVFQLERKRPVTGTVVTMASGKAAGDVSLEAYPIYAEGASASAGAISRFNSTQSDEDGLFDLPLDRGAYDFLFMPDPSSHFPWVWENGVSVDEGDVLLGVELPDPVSLRADVVDALGEPVEGAEIKVYRIISSPVPEEPEQVRQVGKSSTQADGSFVLFIAP